MKNLIYLAVGAIITLSSCQKEQAEIQPNSLNTYSTVYKDTDENEMRVSNLKHFAPNFPEMGQYGCYKPAENCLPEFIVPRSKVSNNNESIQEDFLNFKKLVQEDQSGTGNEVRNFFKSTKWAQFFPHLRKDVAKRIANGDLKITSKTSSNNNNVEIFVVLNNNANISNFIDSDVIIAMPIKN